MRDQRRRQRSGQILVIAVLIISLVLLSTQVYIFDVGKPLDGSHSQGVNDFVLAVKLGSEHVVTGSLANISNGGSNTVLQSKLETWAAFLGGLYQSGGSPILNFELEGGSPYANGTCLSWDASGFAVTSACAHFNFALHGGEVHVQLLYTENVTTSLTVKGVYRSLLGDIKQINVTCQLLNEGSPALASNITLLYQKSNVWLRADSTSSYSFTDYGNGTCQIAFEQEYLSSETVNVSVQVCDLRGICVRANATCTEIS